MKFLLFLTGIAYFFVFFFLGRSWIESNIFPLFFQAQIYILLTILLILYTLEMKNIHWEKKMSIFESRFSLILSFSHFKKILKENLYTFWILLLYISFYFILRWLFENLSISHIFAVINIGAICLYFLSYKSELIYDLIKWNVIITSLFYSLSHILLLFGVNNTPFLPSDYINMMTISILFLLLFLSIRSKKNAWIFACHALVFFLLELSILFYFIVAQEFFIISIIFVLSLIVHLFFYWIDFLKEKTYIPSIFFLRTWNILSYVIIFLWGFLLFWEIWEKGVLYFLTFWLILLHAYYLYLYYKNFWNILSLFFWIFGVFFSLSAWIITYYSLEYFKLLSPFICLWLSISVLTLPYIKKYISSMDLYIIHIFLLWVNILWVILFFIYHEFSILYFWFLLLFEAWYFISNSNLFKKLYPWK